jgi:SAM-dependent methyltransferase
MLEIRAEFRSQTEWRAWVEENRASFDAWRAALLEDIRRYGLVEPVGTLHHAPRDITINTENLRESVAAADLNSRKRAGLFALRLARRGLPPPRRGPTRIVGTEAMTRPGRELHGASYELLRAECPAGDEKSHPLMHTGFPDAAFDLFYSGDVLEHVADLDRALGEIARLLAPGGIMVSTFPFNPASGTTLRRASLDPAGAVVHHLDPEYHGNPARPSEGSLVFAVPGWDILDKAKAAGFADAKMTLVLSSTHGIVAAPAPGVFVMTARKEDADLPAPAVLSDAFSYQGPRLRRLIAITGLARSGTTLLCSILGVHSRIHPVYEPFNASKNRTLPPHIGIGDFLKEFPTEMGAKDILLVKETATQLAFLDRTADLLRSVEPPLAADLIVLLRNPFHVFLSMLEARKKWWGGSHDLSAENFQKWARHNMAGLSRLLQMAQEFNAVIVSYEALVADKERLVPMLMQRLGMQFQERQLDFEKFFDKRQVRGDITLATSPFSISGERVKDRAEELAQACETIRGARHYRLVEETARILSGIEAVGAARFRDPALRPAINALRDVLSSAPAAATPPTGGRASPRGQPGRLPSGEEPV